MSHPDGKFLLATPCQGWRLEFRSNDHKSNSLSIQIIEHAMHTSSSSHADPLLQNTDAPRTHRGCPDPGEPRLQPGLHEADCSAHQLSNHPSVSQIIIFY